MSFVFLAEHQVALVDERRPSDWTLGKTNLQDLLFLRMGYIISEKPFLVGQGFDGHEWQDIE